MDLEVKEIKPMRRLGGGLIDIELVVINQSAETVMKGTWRVLVAGRPEG